MPEQILPMIREKHPLIHCITNYVSANDCANLLLACGASPIMADDPAESAEITAACHALVLNMGIPNPRKLEAMLCSGKEANRLNRPVILDPVGIGSSAMRMDAAQQLLREVRFSVIRGNASEICALLYGESAGRGVDSAADLHHDISESASLLALETGAAVAATGKTDIVTDGKKLFRVFNGHPMMRSVTGSGCQLSALMGACAAVLPENPLEAALAAVCAMGLCGEIAAQRLKPADGNASYRNYIIDAAFRMTPEALQKGANYERIR